MADIQRRYDVDGFRRIRPSERSPGMTEFRTASGRCVQAAGFGPRVDRAVLEAARGLPVLVSRAEETAA